MPKLNVKDIVFMLETAMYIWIDIAEEKYRIIYS